MLLRLLEGVQSDAAALRAVTPSVEQCPHPEHLLTPLRSLPLHMLREEGGRQGGGEDGL